MEDTLFNKLYNATDTENKIAFGEDIDIEGWERYEEQKPKYIAHISIEDNDYRCWSGSVEVEVSTWDEGIDYCKLHTWSGESYHLMKLTSLDYKQQFKSKTIWEESL